MQWKHTSSVSNVVCERYLRFCLYLKSSPLWHCDISGAVKIRITNQTRRFFYGATTPPPTVQLEKW